jgi:putative tricarboxylic transport membrane protein
VRRTDLVCGGFLLALGAMSLVEALRLEDDWQGARLMPGALAIVLVALGVGHLRRSTAAAPLVAWPDGAGWRRVAVVFAALALYVIALPFLGFLFATALFVLFLLRALGRYSWTRTLILTGSIAGGCALVFERWLGMPLP